MVKRNQKKKVIVAGHICIDITPVFASTDNLEHLGDILIPGKLIHMDQADIHTGGAVANTGLAMKLLGADVVPIGKVGQDGFGGMIQNILSKFDVENSLIVDEQSSTSYSIVIAAPGLDRIFLHHPGANDTFCNADIKDEMLEDAALFHFGYPPLMKRMYKNEGEELYLLFKRMKEKGIVTSLDMAAVDANSPVGKVDWKKILTRVLPYVDFFVPSVEEIGFMLDKEKYQNWLLRAEGGDITGILDVIQDVKPLAEELLALGTKVVLIKCGAPGLYYQTSDAVSIQAVGDGLLQPVKEWCKQAGFEKSYKPGKVLSGTGAGDTTIAAFLTAVLNGYSLKECLQLATATGASSVEAYDALGGLKSFDVLKEKIQNGWEKN